MSITTTSSTAASRVGDRCPHHLVPLACARCATPTRAYNVSDEYALATADLEDFDPRTPPALADLRIPPTAVPCPSWCALQPGHGYDSYDAALGHPHRGHELQFDDPAHTWGVAISCPEGLDQTGVRLGVPFIEVYEPRGNEATPEQARAFAAALGRAADRLEQVLAGDVA